MMLLIALALVVAFGASLASAFGWLDLEFWWELALLVDVMLLGHWMEMRALGQASSALEALAELLPETAERVDDVGVVPLAAGVLVPWGFVLPPAAGALAMSLPTVVVAFNALLLRRLDLRPAASATAPGGRRPRTGARQGSPTPRSTT